VRRFRGSALNQLTLIDHRSVLTKTNIQNIELMQKVKFKRTVSFEKI
jgi:hypothetical protein